MLNKAIAHGKEKRKPYKGAKSVDAQCRNHGSCPHCMNNRTYKNMKRLQSALEQERAARQGGSSACRQKRRLRRGVISFFEFPARNGGKSERKYSRQISLFPMLFDGKIQRVLSSR